MTPLAQAVSPLRQRMLDDMRMRKLGGKTQAAYIRAVYRLAAFLQRSPDTASAEAARVNVVVASVMQPTAVYLRRSQPSQPPSRARG